ncbi:MAG: PHP domain-containing protein [Eubacteriales bacterium]|nr:PHP domain-containing protein [Eubacteriales bacterium]
MNEFPIRHDLHCHTRLSLCSNDPAMTPEAILAHARAAGYDEVCLTDHFWDEDVPNPNDFYAAQGLAHVRQNLPLPPHEGLTVRFGCETEYRGGAELGLSPAHYDAFDIILVPLNHFHMSDVRDRTKYHTPEAVAGLFLERLEQLTALPLPWKKVGLAHLNCPLLFDEGNVARVLEILPEDGLRAVFSFYARQGAGIELNAAAFPPAWKEERDAQLRLFRIAKACGCRFYCGSDAHHPAGLPLVGERLPEVVSALGLTAADRWSPRG